MNPNTTASETAPANTATALVNAPSFLDPIHPLAPIATNNNERPTTNARVAVRLTPRRPGSNARPIIASALALVAKVDHVRAATTRPAALATAAPIVTVAGRSSALASVVPAATASNAVAAVNARPPKTALIALSCLNVSTRITGSSKGETAGRTERERA